MCLRKRYCFMTVLAFMFFNDLRLPGCAPERRPRPDDSGDDGRGRACGGGDDGAGGTGAASAGSVESRWCSACCSHSGMSPSSASAEGEWAGGASDASKGT